MHVHQRSLQIVDRMERHSESNAFLTIKDRKQEFPNTIKCRIINPASNNLGKVSKRVLDKINTKCRAVSSVNQWRSTQDVLNHVLHHLDRDSYICNLEQIGKCNSTSAIFKSFFYRTTLLWNQLPQDIRTIPSINVFKTQATQFLWLNAQKNIKYYQTI